MQGLKQKFLSRDIITSGWASIGSCFSAEVMGQSGFDAVCVDMQHGLMTEESAMQMLQAVSATPAFLMVRSRWNDPANIMRLLDCGALGVICPMTNTVEDVEKFVSACRYSPRGNRSFGPIRASVTYGNDYYKNADDSVVTMAMIETEQALQNIDAILDVAELDGIFVGPNDLGIELGQGPVLDTENDVLDKAMVEIAEKARSKGKFAGVFTGSAQGAKRRINQGYQYVVLANDGMYLKQACAKIVKDFKTL